MKKDGLEINISNHFDTVKRLREALKKGKLLYRFDGGAQTEQSPAPVSVTTSPEKPQGVEFDGKGTKKNDTDQIKNVNSSVSVVSEEKKQPKTAEVEETESEKNGKSVCVGVDVKNVGRDVNITSIRTAFAREIANALNEKLVYPENREELEKAIQELSLRHNREVYPEQPKSAAKIQTNSDSTKFNLQNTENEEGRESENAARKGYERSEEERNGMVERAEALGAKLGTAIRVVDDVESLQHSDPEVLEKMKKAKGWYDRVSGRVTIVPGNIEDVEDAVATVMHEVVGHKGMRATGEVYKGDWKAAVGDGSVHRQPLCCGK